MNEANEKISVGIIILAAGGSTRMGEAKQLLEFRGQSLIRRAVETARASHCRPIVVVIGAELEKVRREVEELNVSIVENQNWTDGMSSSIRVGINALAVETNNRIGAAILMLCDQPFITADTLDLFVEAFRENKHKLIVSEYNETRGVPALFSRALFPELTLLEGATGAKQIINKYLDEAFCLAVPEAALDIDTPQDFQTLEEAQH